jgi:hypothetical protein
MNDPDIAELKHSIEMAGESLILLNQRLMEWEKNYVASEAERNDLLKKFKKIEQATFWCAVSGTVYILNSIWSYLT